MEVPKRFKERYGLKNQVSCGKVELRRWLFVKDGHKVAPMVKRKMATVYKTLREVVRG